VAIESRAGADLGLGRHGELAGELEALCREHPLRERLCELLILALYRAGRQAEALGAYTGIRDRLPGELGIDPGPALRELQARILAQDPSLAPASPAPVPVAAPPKAAGNRGDSLVPAPLLETKLYVPRSRRGLVPRPRLSARLDRGAASTLMLVSAPAGFGKTTLLTEWLAGGPAAPAGERLAAWLSLDRGDSDPVSFWTYVIAALRTVALGALGEALGWARERGLSVDDDLSYLREFEHITLARVLLARHQDERAEASVHEATRLLERLLRAAEEGGRTGRVIEILVLQALAHQMLGDIAAALVSLQRVVTLAEPEGYVRVFIDESPPMASLLRALAKQRTAGNYARRLLAAATETEHDGPVRQALIEPLSDRELDVLRLLGTELDGPAIARELVVSLSTVRTHTKHIYAKLAVTNRRAAVRRAAELGLPPTRSRQP
jgi:ATP/maltotriose-dependent transcriptional regulator MalT